MRFASLAGLLLLGKWARIWSLCWSVLRWKRTGLVLRTAVQTLRTIGRREVEQRMLQNAAQALRVISWREEELRQERMLQSVVQAL